MQFKTKARAVDLLGKGQIADLPTAISELWKNGYDAYASELGAILYTKGYEDVDKSIFVLSDDGKGMGYDDLALKWLVLGTDSKSRGAKPEKGKETLWKEPRPIMGEKGIGRLSVSYLGSPMLMLTKKIGQPLQALYFDWRTLENYNLFLDDVNIPIISIKDINSFNDGFDKLKEDFLTNFLGENEEETIKKQEVWEDQKELLESIINSTKKLELHTFFTDEVVQDLIGDSDEIHGTKFIIFEPDEQIVNLKKWSNLKNNTDDKDLDTVEDIRTGLIGFYNEFLEKESDIETSFIIKDHTGERDFIGTNAFFSYDDFNDCDHLIDGQFDKFGTFTGKIRIYEEWVEDYKYRPNKPANEETPYGSFLIKLGYVPGKQDTSLEEARFRYFDEKLTSFGGLYVYRDNLRVLPYGRPHSDFLRFEERRTKRAGSYFFSYRRMFGYISLSRDNNYTLKDKAGREGFINNRAFREFKIDLEGFFIDLAKEYFATESKSDIKQKQQNKLKEQKDLEKEEKQKEKEEKNEFKSKIKQFPDKLKDIDADLKSLHEKLNDKVKTADVIYQEIEFILREIDRLKDKLDSLTPAEPKRFKLDERNKNKFEEVKNLYSDQLKKFEAIQELRKIALRKIKEEQILKEYENKYKNYVSLLNSITEESKTNLKEAFKHIDKEFEKTENKFKDRLSNIYHSNLPDSITRGKMELAIENLESDFSNLRLDYQTTLDAKSDHLLRINFEIDDDALVGMYKQKYEQALKELGDFKSMAQLGIAVEIINHELNSMYSQLSSSINEIGNYLADSKAAQKHYKYLKNSFEHLDSKYQSLNPLYRKSRRTKKYITGLDIKEYLRNFFEETFREENVVLDTTTEFENSETYTFESVLLPAYVNVINNAIYWVRSVEKNPRILLDYNPEGGILIISNNGPKIKDSSLEEIFELFYTRRPKGRGIGLYLSKDGLNSVGLDILATNKPEFNKLNGATFIIKTM